MLNRAGFARSLVTYALLEPKYLINVHMFLDLSSIFLPDPPLSDFRSCRKRWTIRVA